MLQLVPLRIENQNDDHPTNALMRDFIECHLQSAQFSARWGQRHVDPHRIARLAPVAILFHFGCSSFCFARSSRNANVTGPGSPPKSADVSQSHRQIARRHGRHDSLMRSQGSLRA